MPLWQHLACLGSQLGYCWEFRHRMKGWRYSAAVCSHDAGMPSHSRDLQTTSICIKSLCCHQLGVMSCAIWKIPVIAVIIIIYFFFNLADLLKAQLKKTIHIDESFKTHKNESDIFICDKELAVDFYNFKQDNQRGSQWFMANPLWNCHTWFHIPGLMLIKRADNRSPLHHPSYSQCTSVNSCSW